MFRYYRSGEAMRRSEINQAIENAQSFFAAMNFRLPPWARWSPTQWHKKKECDEIVDARLGWDLTDFGSGDFDKRGLLLFTIRNGITAVGKTGKPYAEKIMITKELQETPMHFHWNKMEDIINRGGGNLILELYNSTPDGQLSPEMVTVQVDGVTRRIDAGSAIRLTPGESICLTPGLYHRFYGEKGQGAVLVGEVSMVNDDSADNRFFEPVGRFPAINEDTQPLYLLSTDYKSYV